MVVAHDELFPTPAASPSPLSPTRWAGITPQTVETLKKVLKNNHERWHIFFNDQGFHNHAAHRALAIWALGGDGAIIEAGYKFDSSYQRAAYPSPAPITSRNVYEHLDKREYYDAYLTYFSDEIKRYGLAAMLEKHIFAREANFVDGLPEDKQPRMLDRFLSALVHPLIHTGYGYEFGLPGIVAEGYAQTALHAPCLQNVITSEFFSKYGHDGDTALASLAKKLDITAASKPTGGKKRTHALTIIARLLKDHRTAQVKQFDGRQPGIIYVVRDKLGDVIAKYVEEWVLDTWDPKEVERKYEELVWANVVIYGVGGWEAGSDFNADFSLMHLVTSVLFLPSLLAFLSPPSQALLLRSYFATSLGYWLGRGRPNFDFKGFYSSPDTAYPLPSGNLPVPDEATIPSKEADPNRTKAITPNPWLPLMESTLSHPDEHLIKLQRALAHFNVLYGTQVAGANEGLNGAAEELKGAELLDGSLFIRVAGLTAKRLGRVREGESLVDWDDSGFYSRP
ncbi:hypothetical protein AMATHDRAFT_62722 [Amanita thiersii Skay4041]|uniref:Oxidoreductase AflY n=1 Tax=Amanita thiersii Skay4041 TaxID=703135 RepID=A0A2A9NPL4_9AGAR|nr:hypothetical protein AMATHDRAFT_62722 [Amanita thiersii Skay4041]